MKHLRLPTLAALLLAGGLLAGAAHADPLVFDSAGNATFTAQHAGAGSYVDERLQLGQRTGHVGSVAGADPGGAVDGDDGTPAVELRLDRPAVARGRRANSGQHRGVAGVHGPSIVPRLGAGRDSDRL